jgi:hypothetical protein
MRIEEAIGMSAAQLALMTDEECKKHFDQYLIVTRPEQQPKQKKMEQQMSIAYPKLEEARRLATSVGIVVPVFTSMKGKRK